MLQLKNIKKDYKTADLTVQALKGVDLRFRANEFVSVLGPSGCGKTTLLNIIGGLDHYTSGDLVICGKSTKDYKDRDWDVYRNHRIGFVFQSYNLIPHQTVLGNVEIALTIAGVSKAERKRRAAEALKKVGLEREMNKKPNQLSGGQMQRVAIARALVNNPEILLADEPTGALDTTTSVQIMDLIREIAGERLVIMVTHNPELAEQYSTRIVRLQDGLVVSDSNPYNGELSAESLPKAVTDEFRDGLTAEPPEAQSKKTKQTKREKKAAKKAAKTAKRKEKEARERSSMSFGTSLGLSARNLLMKKGRTAMTSVAGSIGIISVCLVLALSNGFNNYILKMQEDMLSSSPLTISSTTLDVSSILSGMSSVKDMPELDKIGDQVYVNSFLTNIAQGMTVTNNLSKEYIGYLEEAEEYYTTLAYDTGMTLKHSIFTEVEIENENGVTEEVVMSFSELKAYYTLKLTQQEEKYASLAYLVEYLGDMHGKMPGTADVNSEDFGEYVLSQYDLLGERSRFPEKSNEAVLVIGGNNDIIDLTLAQLGFIGENEFLELFPQDGETADDVEEMYIPFDKIIGKKYMVNFNDAIYTPEEEDSNYVYDYVGRRPKEQFDLGAGKGIEVEITGILRLKEGLNYGCLSGGMSGVSGGLYLTEQLYNEVLAENMQSELAKTLRAQSLKVQEFNLKLEELASLGQEDPDFMTKVAGMLALLDEENGKYFKVAAETVSGSYISGSSMANQSGESTGVIDGNALIATLLKKTNFLYGDSAVRSIGGKDSVNSIKIYTDNFDSKEMILAHLDAWNDTHESGEQVKYTDTVGVMMSMVESILDVITYVLVAFTAISLVVSSVMIGIITYVSVVERVKEIGVLRSLGARKKDIKNLFNAETFIIGLASGLIGVLVSYLIAGIVNLILAPLTGVANLAALPVTSAIIMVVISVVLTLISGLMPANAAAKKDPVVALRTE